ncbi:laccase-2 [Neodiprion lecontei]|uniref:Laccase-2 n=1 Tax=Neodiprion lecontei TaxID=441921 RepID=A0A6J0C5U1_NEOLC|nr:laccase-2 [Neodiprion lecontei]
MTSYGKASLLLLAALTIFAPVLGTIVELPTHYNRASPWKDLAKLGIGNLTETDCLRPCIAGEPQRVCLYTFVLEYYAAMGTACGNCSDGVLEDCYLPQCIPADGVEKGVMAINRQIPGPPINVCKNDLIVVNVENKMSGTGSTMHWHGILHRHSQWMDGVPYLTQCPIGGSSFRYAFPADDVGTYFYHSHTGLHRTNGQYGVLTIREPRSEEPWPKDLYEFDLPVHTIFLADWMHETAEMFFPGLPNREPGIAPTTILVNGFGWYLNGTTSEDSVNSSFPLATFHVNRNSSYRFRVINGASQICGFQFQIQDHNLTLIATDGSPIKPITVDAFVSYPGERYDFVINTNNISLDSDAFWIYITGLGACENMEIDQYAVLSYGTNGTDLGIIPTVTRPTVTDPLNFTRVLNYPSTTCGESPEYLCVTDLRLAGYEKDEDTKKVLTAKPDVQLVVPFNFHYFDVDTFHQEGNYLAYENLDGTSIRAGMMSNISFTFPSSPIIFKQRPDKTLCNADNLPTECLKNENSTDGTYCQCTNVVVLRQNDIVELTLVDAADESGIDHPFHLHGYGFYVVRMGSNYTSEEITPVNQGSFYVPPMKDTVSVPSGGFVTVRFRADNPGIWLIHCHFEWHLATGMGMAFWVEGDLPAPPPGFPTCGDFDPLS